VAKGRKKGDEDLVRELQQEKQREGGVIPIGNPAPRSAKPLVRSYRRSHPVWEKETAERPGNVKKDQGGKGERQNQIGERIGENRRAHLKICLSKMIMTEDKPVSRKPGGGVPASKWGNGNGAVIEGKDNPALHRKNLLAVISQTSAPEEKKAGPAKDVKYYGASKESTEGSEWEVQTEKKLGLPEGQNDAG